MLLLMNVFNEIAVVFAKLPILKAIDIYIYTR
jgi:hypothetical protein